MSRLERFAVAVGDRAAWLFVVGAAITVYEVAVRYFFNAPTTWVHVTTTTLCAIAFCAGGAYAMARDEHVRITSMVERWPARWQRASRVLGLVCGVVYLAGLGFAAVQQAAESVWRFDGTPRRWVPELVPGPPHWPLPALLRVALAIGALLFLAVVVAALLRTLAARRIVRED